jgi:hypothetical protein
MITRKEKIKKEVGLVYVYKKEGECLQLQINLIIP